MKKIIFLLFIVGLHNICIGQQTQISGVVISAEDSLPMPFVLIELVGTDVNTTTDFDGKYSLETDRPFFSLRATFVSYKPRESNVERGKKQTINFTLTPFNETPKKRKKKRFK